MPAAHLPRWFATKRIFTSELLELVDIANSVLAHWAAQIRLRYGEFGKKHPGSRWAYNVFEVATIIAAKAARDAGIAVTPELLANLHTAALNDENHEIRIGDFVFAEIKTRGALVDAKRACDQ